MNRYEALASVVSAADQTRRDELPENRVFKMRGNNTILERQLRTALSVDGRFLYTNGRSWFVSEVRARVPEAIVDRWLREQALYQFGHKSNVFLLRNEAKVKPPKKARRASKKAVV